MIFVLFRFQVINVGWIQNFAGPIPVRATITSSFCGNYMHHMAYFSYLYRKDQSHIFGQSRIKIIICTLLIGVVVQMQLKTKMENPSYGFIIRNQCWMAKSREKMFDNLNGSPLILSDLFTHMTHHQGTFCHNEGELLHF